MELQLSSHVVILLLFYCHPIVILEPSHCHVASCLLSCQLTHSSAPGPRTLEISNRSCPEASLPGLQKNPGLPWYPQVQKGHLRWPWKRHGQLKPAETTRAVASFCRARDHVNLPESLSTRSCSVMCTPAERRWCELMGTKWNRTDHYCTRRPRCKLFFDLGRPLWSHAFWPCRSPSEYTKPYLARGISRSAEPTGIFSHPTALIIYHEIAFISLPSRLDVAKTQVL